MYQCLFLWLVFFVCLCLLFRHPTSVRIDFEEGNPDHWNGVALDPLGSQEHMWLKVEEKNGTSTQEKQNKASAHKNKRQIVDIFWEGIKVPFLGEGGGPITEDPKLANRLLP